MLKKDEYLFYWRVGKWGGLCPECDCLSNAEKVRNPDLTMDKYPKILLCTIQILHHVALAIDMCARMFERLVLSMQSWFNDCWMLCARCCSLVLSWLSDLETRYQRSFVMYKLLWDRKRFSPGRHKLGSHMQNTVLIEILARVKFSV